MSWNPRHPVAPALFSSVELWAWQFWQQPRNLNSYRCHSVKSTKSCSGLSTSPAISGKPGAIKGTNLRKCFSCRRKKDWRRTTVSSILLTGFGFLFFLNKGIAFTLLYTELYSYFITFVCCSVNCVLIVMPLNATLYYVSPHRKLKSRSIWRPSF